MDSAPIVEDLQQPAKSRKRSRRSVSPNLSDAKGKRKRRTRERRRRGTSELSTSRQPAKTYAELIEHKSVGKSATILINRTNNRTKTVRNFLLESLRTKEQTINSSPLWAKLQKIKEDLDGMEAEILRIKEDIRNVPVDYKKGILTEAEAKQRLIEMEDRESKKLLQDSQVARQRLDQVKQDLQVERERLDQIKQEKKKSYEMSRQLEPVFVKDTDYTRTLNEENARLEDENKALNGVIESKEAALQSALAKASMVEDLQNKNQELMKQIEMYKVWEMVLCACQLVASYNYWFEILEWVQVHGKGRTLLATIIRLAWNCLNYYVWQERNGRIHGRNARQISDIYLRIKQDVRWRLGRNARYTSSNSFLVLEWGL